MIAESIRNDMQNGSWIRKMFEEGDRLRAIHGPVNVFDFSLGNPDSEPPAATLSAMQRLVAEPNIHKYMSNAGYPEVRAAIAERLSKDSGLNVSASNIVMTVGAAGGLNVALHTLLSPGDEVIVLAPYFAEYLFYIRNHGGVPVIAQTDTDTFQPDLAAVRTAITPRTRAILLNNPNNPSGAVYDARVLQSLAALLSEKEKEIGHAIAVLSDEPYAALVYDGLHVENLLPLFKNVMVINSFSKSLALPGERIGYIAVSPNCEEVETVVAGMVFSTRTLGFVNAPGLMQKVIAASMDAKVDVAEYQARRDLLYDILCSAGFTCRKPGGAFYLFPKSPIEDDVAFVQSAVKYNLLLVPGRGFGRPGYFRMAYCVGRDTIERSRQAFLQLGKEYFK